MRSKFDSYVISCVICAITSLFTIETIVPFLISKLITITDRYTNKKKHTHTHTHSHTRARAKQDTGVEIPTQLTFSPLGGSAVRSSLSDECLQVPVTCWKCPLTPDISFQLPVGWRVADYANEGSKYVNVPMWITPMAPQPVVKCRLERRSSWWWFLAIRIRWLFAFFLRVQKPERSIGINQYHKSHITLET